MPPCSAEWNHLCNFCRGHYAEHFCEIILNSDQWFSKRCGLKDLLSRALAALRLGGDKPLSTFGRGHYGEYSFEIILNLDQWFRRCRLKKRFMDGR